MPLTALVLSDRADVVVLVATEMTCPLSTWANNLTRAIGMLFRAAGRDKRLSAMNRSEIEQVLRNWIGEAMSPVGRFVKGIDPPAWVAETFIAWWQKRVEDSLDRVEGSAGYLVSEASELAEAASVAGVQWDIHEVREALEGLREKVGDLREAAGLARDPGDGR